MSNVGLVPKFNPPPPENPARRKMLVMATTATTAVGCGFVAVPFLSSWLPSERAKAIGAPVSVDLSKLAFGALQTVLWQGKVVYIFRRTPEMIEDLNGLADQLRDPDSIESLQPEYAKNVSRASNPEYLVMLGVCTHLGCAPSLESAEQGRTVRGDSAWLGGFFCPCHGSKFDYAGRVYKGVPAPTNMTIPPHRFDGTTVIIGEDPIGG